MTTFANAVVNQVERTENGMKAFASTNSACVNLFYNIGASRGKDIIPEFVAAYVEDIDIALRIAQWSRDIRGGAGERQIFRDILKWAESNVSTDELFALMRKVPELGRWDDLLVFETPIAKDYAYGMIKSALYAKNGLAAKWCPRKGSIAVELTKYLGYTPRHYRKTLVELTKVVETQMCANEWDNIEFSHVPSLAHSRYKKAFNRHTAMYADYVSKLVAGDTSVKVNAGAVYPYDVLKGHMTGYISETNKTEQDLVIQQWNALENFVGDANILPMVDVSGSMMTPVGGSKNLMCMDVAVSLGLYLADKNCGKFKNVFLTFSAIPQLVKLEGNILQKVQQTVTSSWGMNTNLVSAIDNILQVATNGKVLPSEMPKALVVLSDMQFDQCASFDDSAMDMIRRKYIEVGYQMPVIVFWNLRSTNNVPAKYDERGVVLISGFSPAIMKAVLAINFEEITPEAIMMSTIMVERYNLS